MKGVSSVPSPEGGETAAVTTGGQVSSDGGRSRA